MSFSGNDPYGTPGGIDLFNALQDPPDIRLATGKTYVFFLRVNGILREKNRENVEDVIRVLGLRGESLLAIVVRKSGTVVDPGASDIDFLEVLDVIEVAPGVIQIQIIPNSIATAMYKDLSVTLAKMAAGSVDASKIVDGTITLVKMAAGSVDSSKIVDGSIVDADINAAAAIAGSKFADNSIALAKLAAGSVDSSKIVDGSIVNADINAAAAIDGSKLAATSIPAGKYGAASIATADVADAAITGVKQAGVAAIMNRSWSDGNTSVTGTVTLLTHTIVIPNDVFYDVFVFGNAFSPVPSGSAIQRQLVTIASNGTTTDTYAPGLTANTTIDRMLTGMAFLANQKNVTITSTLQGSTPGTAAYFAGCGLFTFAIPRI